MHQVVSETDCLSASEVLDALNHVAPADWKRAERFADVRARGLHGIAGEDLVSEACVQLLGLQRRFPRAALPLVVLKNVIRSCASNTRKSAAERRRDDSVSVEPECDPSIADDLDAGRPIAAGAIDAVTPEAEILAKEQLDSLLTSLADDPDAELVALAWADGLRGDEGAKATGLDAKAYDAARKRLLRKRQALDTNGERS